MTTPFDQIAPRYAALWSESARGQAQRQQVWRILDGLFQPGDRVLDLGCGTGDDAVHLASRAVRVVGIDAAAAMIEIARGRGVDAFQMRLEELSSLEDGFDGALSNFGALNCVADLQALGAALARLIRPRGKLALCVMSRYCWGDWKHLRQRWSGHTTWRGLDVYYRSAPAIARAFEPGFALERRVSIGHGDHQLLLLARRPLC